MAMSLGTSNQLKSDVNMTPMIDVLLVLIIIFMVIVPVAPVGLDALIPQPSRKDHTPTTPPDDIVITVHSDKSINMNLEAIGLDKLAARLKGIWNNRGNRTVFIRGEGSLEFQQIAEVIDIAKGAGADRIGLMSR